MEFYTRNVNEAFYMGCQLFTAYRHEGMKVSPRGKPTLEWPEPVVTHYVYPAERVLFDETRDCNPFLHFFESLWLLAGRRDLKFMDTIAPQFKEYSDDGEVLQGSYGFRWRHAFDYDQLKTVIELLIRDRSTRRAVLTMWSPWDLNMGVFSRDIPCNTQVYFKIREDRLRMTVVNRSNDMIWGAYGSNYVQFSMLQEYIADQVGVQMGSYSQVSDSFHVYLQGKEGEVWQRVSNAFNKKLVRQSSYYDTGCKPYPLKAGRVWDDDLHNFFHQFDAYGKVRMTWQMFTTPWWREVAVPIWNVFVERKQDDVNLIAAEDWRLYIYGWLLRRTAK